MLESDVRKLVYVVGALFVVLVLPVMAFAYSPDNVQQTITGILSNEKALAFVFGVVFVVALLILAILFPNPTDFQYTVFRIVLALAAAGVAAMIPGFLQVEVNTWIRAGGALAIFVIVYFYSPAKLVKQR